MVSSCRPNRCDARCSETDRRMQARHEPWLGVRFVIVEAPDMAAFVPGVSGQEPCMAASSGRWGRLGGLMGLSALTACA